MQLRISLPLANKIACSNFKYSTSSLLAGITLVGVFSTAIYNSTTANSKVSESFEKFSKAITTSTLFDGISKIGSTLKTWGTSIVSSKDDFKQWLIDYFNPSGLKSGAVNLYEKLVAWGTIVYEWFRDKFLKFIENIPEMVKNWKNLRLSLFKWGTFLGGGGGSALWAMFGLGDNWGRLAELMGDPKFGEIVEKFGELMQDNAEAFASMDQEDAQDILEQFLEDSDAALETTKELLEQQKENNKDKKEGEPMDELSKEAIKEAFSKWGSPKSPEGVFQNMLSGGMDALVNLHNSFFGSENPKDSAKKAMEKYLSEIKTKAEKTKNKATLEFLEVLKEGNKENEFVEAISEAASKAFLKVQKNGTVSFDKLSEALGTVLEETYLEACKEGECNGQEVNLKEKIPTVSLSKQKGSK